MHVTSFSGQQIIYTPNLTKSLICFSSHIPHCPTENVAQSTHGEKLRKGYLQAHSQNGDKYKVVEM